VETAAVKRLDCLPAGCLEAADLNFCRSQKVKKNLSRFSLYGKKDVSG
jgi:hypothetical protein